METSQKENEMNQSNSESQQKIPEVEAHLKLQQPDLEQVAMCASTFVDRASFDIDDECLSATLLDDSHVGMIDLALGASMCEKYEINKSGRFGIDIKDLLNAVREFDKNSAPFVDIQDNQIILHTKDTRFKLPLVEYDSAGQVPKLQFNYIAELDETCIKKWTDTFKKMAKYGQHVWLDTKEYDPKESIKAKTEFDSKEMELKLPISNLVRHNEGQATKYYLPFMKPFFNSLQKNRNAQLSFSTKMPLQVRVWLGNFEGRIDFYTAPQNES